MSNINVILIDDHIIVREGIKLLLLKTKDIKVIGEASNGFELFELLKTKNPDIVILDLIIPEYTGIEITKILRNNYPYIKVIILSAKSDVDCIFESISAGAYGYLPKNVNHNELLKAIYMVSAGQQFLSELISTKVLMDYIELSRLDKTQKKELTLREIEIVELFAEGLTYKEIASHLVISVRTVEAHKNNIMSKLELNSIADLVKYAIKKNIIEL